MTSADPSPSISATAIELRKAPSKGVATGNSVNVWARRKCEHSKKGRGRVDFMVLAVYVNGKRGAGTILNALFGQNIKYQRMLDLGIGTGVDQGIRNL